MAYLQREPPPTALSERNFTLMNSFPADNYNWECDFPTPIKLTGVRVR